MKLFRWGSPGLEKPGIIDKDGVLRDLSAHIDDLSQSTISRDLFDRIGKLELASLPQLDASVRVGPCVDRPGKFICIGLNYADHASETGAEIPAEPVLFSKAVSAAAGPNDSLHLPPGSKATDWEVELGVVIGRTAKLVSEENASDYIAGFCVVNDYSERDYQLSGTGQWVKGKSFDGFGPIGPWLVSPDEIDNVDNLPMWLEVNGRRYQDGNTRTMIYKVPELLAYVSRFMTLEPGDIISTGTPPGVGLGQDPPTYLRDGDIVELSILGLGTQRQKIVGT